MPARKNSRAVVTISQRTRKIQAVEAASPPGRSSSRPGARPSWRATTAKLRAFDSGRNAKGAPNPDRHAPDDCLFIASPFGLEVVQERLLGTEHRDCADDRYGSSVRFRAR